MALLPSVSAWLLGVTNTNLLWDNVSLLDFGASMAVMEAARARQLKNTDTWRTIAVCLIWWFGARPALSWFPNCSLHNRVRCAGGGGTVSILAGVAPGSLNRASRAAPCPPPRLPIPVFDSSCILAGWARQNAPMAGTLLAWCGRLRWIDPALH